MISVSALVSGKQLGGLLAGDSEEAAFALVALAKNCDVAELTDYLENEMLGKDGWIRDRLSGLESVIRDALERTQR
jgi:hypothetical protein